MLKKPLFWLILFLGLVWLAVFQAPDNQLHLVFCDVGQGDAILASYHANQILIDGGPNKQVLDCLANHLPFWDRQIEMVIATHPDADHLTGLIDVIERYDIQQFVINSRAKDSGVFREFQRVIGEERVPVFFPKKGDRIKLGDLSMTVLWPESQEKVLGATTVDKEANETSTVVQLSFGSFDVLLPGDISSKIENQLQLEDIEVLKVAHHGSKFSTSEEFLDQIQPELAIISVGRNSFGHPTQEVLERLKDRSIKCLRTDQEGTVEIISDGGSWELK